MINKLRNSTDKKGKQIIKLSNIRPLLKKKTDKQVIEESQFSKKINISK